jgi:retron-type reverse transcriptase
MHVKEQKDWMSAEKKARSVSRAEGVDRVRALQRLFAKVARSDILDRAWREVRANRGAAGADGITIDEVEASGVGDFLDQLAEQLGTGTCRPRSLRRVHIPSPGRPDQTRPLGIPTVADRVVMAAARIVLEPIFEADFLPESYGFHAESCSHSGVNSRCAFCEYSRKRANRPERCRVSPL